MSKDDSDQTVLLCNSKPEDVHVVLAFNIDLSLLRTQKRALIGVYEGGTVTYEQEEAAEGLLNLIDFIQDSIVEQGLATEEEVFPRLPQLFEDEPKTSIHA